MSKAKNPAPGEAGRGEVIANDVGVDGSDSRSGVEGKKQEISAAKSSDHDSHLWKLKGTMTWLRSIGAAPRSMLTAVISEKVGKYERVTATIRFKKSEGGDWEIITPKHLEPKPETAALIKAELGTVKWPEWTMAYGVFDKSQLPKPYCSLPDDSLFILRSPAPDGKDSLPKNSKLGPEALHPIIMIQARLEIDGHKVPVPLTYWDDGKWRKAEPARKLPVFGMEQFHQNYKEVAFIHEGPKAARAARRIAEAYEAYLTKNAGLPDNLKTAPSGDAAHPWAHDLAAGIHLGWIGGALRPDGTDWKEFEAAAKRAGIKRIVIVADSDVPGRKALPEISKRLEMVIDHLIFDGGFPEKFDLADEWPSMIVEGDGEFAEKGEKVKVPFDVKMSEMLVPGTYMTYPKFDPARPKAKPTPTLTEVGALEWAYIPESLVYVSVRYPRLVYDKEQFNGTIRALSGSKNTADLIQANPYGVGRPMRLTYTPAKTSGLVSDGETLAFNTHRPSNIRPKPGSAQPWLDLLAYMFPDPDDRKHVERWCATLIAKPERKMIFALLVVSEKQGIGKNTLGTVLAELVGKHNASFPREADITSDYNDWMSETRIAICSEIYSGHSWSAYNKLKTHVTDEIVRMERKYMRSVDLPNWTHILACSNSFKALKIADDDRRWFIPKVAEVPWTRDKFVKFRAWLFGQGLGEILHWALNYGDYVLPGEIAPMSASKLEVIEEARSDAAKAVIRLAEWMVEEETPRAITIRNTKIYAKNAVGRLQVNEPDQELASLMKVAGLERWGRVKVDGHLETILVNTVAKTELDNLQVELLAAEGIVLAEGEEMRNPEVKEMLNTRMKKMLVDLPTLYKMVPF